VGPAQFAAGRRMVLPGRLKESTSYQCEKADDAPGSQEPDDGIEKRDKVGFQIGCFSRWDARDAGKVPGPLKIGFSLAVKRDPMFEKLGMLLGVQSDSEPGEIRYIITGMVNDVLLTVVYTERGERTRIISTRKATKHEQEEPKHCAAHRKNLRRGITSHSARCAIGNRDVASQTSRPAPI
jgi:uncharacterized DUF497 family protein